MLVSRLMRRRLVLATPECGFKTLLCKMGKLAPRQIYVVEDDLKLKGIITGYDLLKVVLPKYMDSNLLKSIQEPEIDDYLRKCINKVADKKAGEIMITEFVFLKPTDHVMEAESLIVEKGINALPVLDENGRLLGEVNRRDILEYMAGVCDICSQKEFGIVNLEEIRAEEDYQSCFYKLLEEDE